MTSVYFFSFQAHLVTTIRTLNLWCSDHMGRGPKVAEALFTISILYRNEGWNGKKIELKAIEQSAFQRVEDRNSLPRRLHNLKTEKRFSECSAQPTLKDRKVQNPEEKEGKSSNSSHLVSSVGSRPSKCPDVQEPNQEKHSVIDESCVRPVFSASERKSIRRICGCTHNGQSSPAVVTPRLAVSKRDAAVISRRYRALSGAA